MKKELDLSITSPLTVAITMLLILLLVFLNSLIDNEQETPKFEPKGAAVDFQISGRFHTVMDGGEE